MKHILHITNDFGGTEVYRNLYKHLDELGVKQTVFVPLNNRVRYRKGNHVINFKTEGSRIIYSLKQKWYHRYLYERKISLIVKEVESQVKLNEISLIHTGTLCMTGAVAYEISREIKIPFIVSVRNTDINAYFKKLWWKKSYFYSILNSASSVIFISPQYKCNCFEKHFPRSIINKIEKKTKVIPNGIDHYFLNNISKTTKIPHTPIEIVFAGGFSPNKNLLRLIYAVEMLNNKGVEVNLTAIGRSLPNRKVSKDYIELIEKATKDKSYISLLRYKKKEELCDAYNDFDIFAMPSIHETFGLSYAEALSQGLPIIYTKGQGFDGFYKDGVVGFSINPLSTEDIVRGIESVIANYSSLSYNVVNQEIEKDFDWKEIAGEYTRLYSSIIESTK